MAFTWSALRLVCIVDGVPGTKTIDTDDISGIPAVLVSPEVLAGSLTLDLQSNLADTELFVTNTTGGGFVADIRAQGNLKFMSGTAFTGAFDHAITANRTWALPDAGGNLLVAEATNIVNHVATTLRFNVEDGAASVFEVFNAGAGLIAHILVSGDINFRSGTAFDGNLVHGNTGNRTYTFPDASGAVMVEAAGAYNITNSGFDINVIDGGVTIVTLRNSGAGLWCDLLVSGDLFWNSQTAFTGSFLHANTANRTYTYPDYTGNVPIIDAADTIIKAGNLTLDLQNAVADTGLVVTNSTGAGNRASVQAQGEFVFGGQTSAFNGVLAHVNTALRTYTFPDVTGNILADTAVSVANGANSHTITSLATAARAVTLPDAAGGVALGTIVANIPDLGVFTDPPTAGEMATLRTTVNSIITALEAFQIATP